MARIVLCCSYVIGVASPGRQEDESYYPSLRLKVGTSTSAVGPKIDYSLLANRQSVNFVMPDHTVNIYI